MGAVMAKKAGGGGTPATTLSTTVQPVSQNTAKNQDIDGLLSGSAWRIPSSDSMVTYSFPNAASDYGKSYSEANRGFEAFTAAQQTAMRSILASVEAVTHIRFRDLTGTTSDGRALMRFAESDKTPEAWSYYPSERDNGGDAWFNNSADLFERPDIGTYAHTTFMHEVGHTLGLKHSFETAGFGPVPRDSLEYTVMSYSSFEGARDWLSAPSDYPQTLMMYDIAALQRMYGADFGTNAGGTTYRWDWTSGALSTTDAGRAPVVFDAPDTNTVFMTVWDGGGTDTYDFSDWRSGLRIDLRPGEWVSELGADRPHTANLNGKTAGSTPVWADGIVANALSVRTYDAAGDVTSEDVRSFIENARGGSGADVLVANRATNVLTGGLGQDTFAWVSLGDLVNGGSGWDEISDFAQGDRIDLTAIEGLDAGEVSFADGLLLGDLDGTGGADFAVRVAGTIAFDPAWVLV